MRRPICAFVVRICHKKAFSWRGSESINHVSVLCYGLKKYCNCFQQGLISVRDVQIHFISGPSKKPVGHVNFLIIDKFKLVFSEEARQLNHGLAVEELSSRTQTFSSKSKRGEGKWGSGFAVLWTKSFWVESEEQMCFKRCISLCQWIML